MFLTFNSDAPVPVELRPVGVEEAEVELALGAMILWSSGAGRDYTSQQLRLLKLRVMNLGDAIELVRGALKLDAEGVLLVCIDELVRVSSPAQRGQVLAAGMRYMDGHCKTVFVFSALVGKDVEAWRGNTGRGIADGLELPLLHSTAVEAAVRSEAHAAAHLLEMPAVRKLLLQCGGHPRAVFDFFLPSLLKMHGAHPQGDIPVAALSRICATASQLLRVPDSLTVELVGKLVSPVGRLTKLERLNLSRSGLMTNGFVLPIFLREWAYNDMYSSDGTKDPLAMHINKVYEVDQAVATGAEKMAEGVFLHWAAARRLALGPTPCSLAAMFGKGCRIKTNITGLVTVCPPGASVPDEVLVYVKSFQSHPVDVISSLRHGHIVVSELPPEAGVEYLAPLWTQTGKMVVLGVQIKFEPRGSTFAVLADKVQQAVGNLFKNEKAAKAAPLVVSLIFTTHHTNHAETPPDSICFDLSALPAYLGALGPLRLLLEKGTAVEKD